MALKLSLSFRKSKSMLRLLRSKYRDLVSFCKNIGIMCKNDGPVGKEKGIKDCNQKVNQKMWRQNFREM